MTKKGYRIWEIQKNGVPKEVTSGKIEDFPNMETLNLDIENKTFAIRIGKEGLK